MDETAMQASTKASTHHPQARHSTQPVAFNSPSFQSYRESVGKTKQKHLTSETKLDGHHGTSADKAKSALTTGVFSQQHSNPGVPDVQKANLVILERQLIQAKRIYNSVALGSLPDKGARLKNQVESLEQAISCLKLDTTEEKSKPHNNSRFSLKEVPMQNKTEVHKSSNAVPNKEISVSNKPVVQQTSSVIPKPNPIVARETSGVAPKGNVHGNQDSVRKDVTRMSPDRTVTETCPVTVSKELTTQEMPSVVAKENVAPKHASVMIQKTLDFVSKDLLLKNQNLCHTEKASRDVAGVPQVVDVQKIPLAVHDVTGQDIPVVVPKALVVPENTVAAPERTEILNNLTPNPTTGNAQGTSLRPAAETKRLGQTGPSFQINSALHKCSSLLRDDDTTLKSYPKEMPWKSGWRDSHVSQSFQHQTKLISYVPAIPASEWKTKVNTYNNQPLYGGRMTEARKLEVKLVTEDALRQLHSSLQTCPLEHTEETDPEGLKLPLMLHQRQALAWLLWREKQVPSGGVLADDMGLGKTLTMVSLVLKQRERRKSIRSTSGSINEVSKDVSPRTTLVVCPASLIHQWNKEVDRHCQKNALKVLVYHGSNRNHDLLSLSKHDLVITSYNLVVREMAAELNNKQKSPGKEKSGFSQMFWERIVLDEAHAIKNPKTLTAQAVCCLSAKSRWAVTGTPIHNDLKDMYSLIKFLQFSPFDEYKVWMKWVDNKTAQGTQRLSTVMKSLLLRRTKEQKDGQGNPLVKLPMKSLQTYTLHLNCKERTIYDKMLSHSRSALHRFISKDDTINKDGIEAGKSSNSHFPSSECQPSQLEKVSGSLLLVMLLRLQQCCCHLSLLRKAVEQDIDTSENSEDSQVDISLQMSRLSLGGPQQIKDSSQESLNTSPEKNLNLLGLSQYAKDDDFIANFCSTKIQALIGELKRLHKEDKIDDIRQKSVVVSQWTCMLDVIAHHLDEAGFNYHMIHGKIKPDLRMEAIEDFNYNPNGAKVMLLSLKAGGVGLNLIGGNHIFLTDIHWNPALENQACDRIYRVGQTRNVFIHKFICKNTIEEQIVKLQSRKMFLAKGVLEGARVKSHKLTLDDLKTLFQLDMRPDSVGIGPH